MINPDPVVVTALTDNPLNKVFNETLQAYENPKRLETFIDEVLLYARIVELVREGYITFEELKDPKKKPKHTNKLKSYMHFLIPSLNLENRAPRKNIGNDAAVRSSLLKVGFYVNLFIGVSFSIERVTKFDPITLRSLEKYGHVLNEALKHFIGFVQDRFYDALPDLSFKQNWAEDYKHFRSNIERKREERKPNYFEPLPGQESPAAQPASGQSQEDGGATTDTLRKRVAESCDESDENDHATAQPLQKRAKTVGEVRAELPTAANTGGCLQEYQTPNAGPLTTSPSVTQDQVLRTAFSGPLVRFIDAQAGLNILRSDPDLCDQRTILTLATNYSCLTLYPAPCSSRDIFRDRIAELAKDVSQDWPLDVPRDTPVYRVKRDEGLHHVGTECCNIKDRARLAVYKNGGIYLTFFLNEENGGGLIELEGSCEVPPK